MVATMSLLVLVLAGCSAGKAEEPTDNDLKSSTGEIQQEALDSGKVGLKVWAEEGNFETLGKMIESFKKEYAGQADFEIILEASADGEARNNVLGDIHNSADIFSMPDDQLYSLIAGGALSPVTNQEQVKTRTLKRRSMWHPIRELCMRIRIPRTTAIFYTMIRITLRKRT